MIKSKHFEKELNLIKDENLRKVITDYLEDYVPNYFWEIGASASGKYHPRFTKGKGGLVRHVKAVVMFADELLRISSYAYMKDIYKDYVIGACIIHDCAKYGMTNEMDKTQFRDHAENGAIMFRNFCDEIGVDCPLYLFDAVRTHMGQWSTEGNNPFTQVDRCVHMADYMASRSFIDIPSITEEYNEVEGE